MSIYDPLKNYLLNKRGSKSLRLTFQQFDGIVSSNNAKSKYYLRQWWQNSYSPERRHVQAEAWQRAGWKVSEVDFQRQVVTFVEEDSQRNIKPFCSLVSDHLPMPPDKSHPLAL